MCYVFARTPTSTLNAYRARAEYVHNDVNNNNNNNNNNNDNNNHHHHIDDDDDDDGDTASNSTIS